MTIKVVCPLMGSFKTILKSIRPFFVDRLARNVHFNTNPIGFLLNRPKNSYYVLYIDYSCRTRYFVHEILASITQNRKFTLGSLRSVQSKGKAVYKY